MDVLILLLKFFVGRASGTDMEDGHHGEDTPGSDTDTGDTGVVDTEDTEVII